MAAPGHGWRAVANILLFIVAAVLPGTGAGVAADSPVSEHGVKAAFLYQFTNFVEWPADAFADSEIPFTIAVIGADAVAGELARVVAGRNAGGRPFEVRRIRRGDSLTGVHMLFIGESETAKLGDLMVAHPRNILTVTEARGALDHGSMINFIVIDRRVRFEVALDSAERSGLRMSSRLLSVAQHVRKRPH